MRDRMERLVVLPLSLGCISHASISVVEPPSRGSPASNTKSSSKSREGLEEESVYQERTKNSSKILIQPKSNISTGVNKLVKSFRSLSQLFAYEDELFAPGNRDGDRVSDGCETCYPYWMGWLVRQYQQPDSWVA